MLCALSNWSDFAQSSRNSDSHAPLGLWDVWLRPPCCIVCEAIPGDGTQNSTSPCFGAYVIVFCVLNSSLSSSSSHCGMCGGVFYVINIELSSPSSTRVVGSGSYRLETLS